MDAYVIDSKNIGQDLKDLLVVRNYLNVFLEKLPGLPPKREIEFEINLVPKETPISNPPTNDFGRTEGINCAISRFV